MFSKNTTSTQAIADTLGLVEREVLALCRDKCDPRRQAALNLLLMVGDLMKDADYQKAEFADRFRGVASTLGYEVRSSCGVTGSGSSLGVLKGMLGAMIAVGEVIHDAL
ncbi:hypothetical protein HYZ80_01530 [Candidatus Parcubacteria bacterium]|nr:hypothetical protein [Candidatus Parcubacteria bacterium]